MSRSFKKSPVVSPSSSKEFNSKANRAMRKLVRTALHKLTLEENDSLILPLQREVSNIYDSPKDGRCNMFGSDMTGEDGAWVKKLMRK
jgi:hypothetical protein